MRNFVEHEWNVLEADDIRELETAECPHCHMRRLTIEGAVEYKLPARTPSGMKDAIIPPGAAWPEPSCKPSLRSLGQRLRDKSISKELNAEESCCVSFTNEYGTVWECGGAAVCDCETCHMVSESEDLVA